MVDLQPLNAVSVRETHHTPSPWNLVSAIPKGVKKTILDAKDGYHSIPLAPESRPLTTFICEWGRYWYLRAPQGWTGSGDAYTKRVDEITADVVDHVCCIDDACLWKVTVEDSFWHTVRYIDRCGRNGVIFNPTKFVFAADIADFAGFTVTLDSIKPTLKMTKAIREFPIPKSITGIRSWFGLINQVSYTFAQSEIMYPFREILKHKRKFYWDETLSALFEKSKENIVAKIENGVKIFEANRITCLATDWSKTGVGFLLLQKHCRCIDTSEAPRCGPAHWQLIFAGSRFLKDPESRYSPIEGEALAVTFALEQARMFVTGCPNLIIATDHKPLVPILNDKGLDLIKNPRLLRLKEKTLMYHFVAQHIPGPMNFAADATSRNPCNADTDAKALLLSIASLENNDDTGDAGAIHTALVNAVMAGDDDIVAWSKVKEAASKDDSCMFICDAIENGFPEKRSDAAECLRPYFKLKESLYSLDGVPFLDGRMFIPKSLRREILAILHSAHQGPAGMKAAARHRFWWLGMDSDIDQVRAQCKDCNEGAPSNIKEPLSASVEPEYPWQLAAMDYFDLAGVKYLVVADRFSGWPEIFRQNGKVMTLVRTCRNLFAQFGVPLEVSSDGGPPFNSYEWKIFLVQWDVRFRKSSANYPQSNGRAELAVKSCKRMLRSNTDTNGNLDTAKVTKALLQYRNTPIPGLGMSPAYMLFGRQLRDALPTHPDMPLQLQGRPGSIWSEIRQQREIATAKKNIQSAEYYNAHKRPLYPLVVGDPVSIQNRSGSHPLRWDRTGRIVERLENKQYLVKTDGSGRVLLRTRGHLRKIDPITQESPDRSAPAARSEPEEDNRPQNDALFIPGKLTDGTRVVHPTQMEEPSSDIANIPEMVQTQSTPEPIASHQPAPSTVEMPGTLRRSTRVRNPPKILSPCMQGKHHTEVQRT